MTKKAESKYVVTAMDMTPFRHTVLFIAGDWRAAASTIDNEILDSKDDSISVSDKVLKLIAASGFEFDDCQGATMYRKEITDNLIVILMREPNPELGIVVHECHHATMMTLAEAGVDDRNHEVSAYLLENLVRICMNAINKNNKKEKKKNALQNSRRSN